MPSSTIQKTDDAVFGPQRYGKNYAGQWNCYGIATSDKMHEHLASSKQQQAGRKRPKETPGSLWQLRERLNNLHSPDSLQSIPQKKRVAWPCSPQVRMTAVMEITQKRTGRRPDPLRRPDARQSSCTYEELRGRTAAPHAIPCVRAVHPASAAKDSPPGSRRGPACPVRPPPLPPPPPLPGQSNRYVARAAVLIMTSAHGFHVFWRLSGSKACSRRGAAPRRAPAKPT